MVGDFTMDAVCFRQSYSKPRNFELEPSGFYFPDPRVMKTAQLAGGGRSFLHNGASCFLRGSQLLFLGSWDLCFKNSGQINHQPRFPWTKEMSLHLAAFWGPRSCDVARIWPENSSHARDAWMRLQSGYGKKIHRPTARPKWSTKQGLTPQISVDTPTNTKAPEISVVSRFRGALTQEERPFSNDHRTKEKTVKGDDSMRYKWISGDAVFVFFELLRILKKK